MTALIAGLVLFLAPHSVRIFADDWRGAQRARLGENTWKGLYSLLSIAGFALLVWGYGQVRWQSPDLWLPPLWTRHLAALLLLPSMVLLVAAFVPRNAIKARLRHPMILGVKLWAAAHLLANGRLADVVLFGCFLAWAVLCFRAARQRDALAGADAAATRAGGQSLMSALTVVLGLAVWAAFAGHLHLLLIGVRPFGG